MAAEDFENIIGKRFKEFGIDAPEKVWDSVEAHLDSKERKRRFGIIWWFSGLAATITLGAILLRWNQDNYTSKHQYELASIVFSNSNQETLKETEEKSTQQVSLTNANANMANLTNSSSKSTYSSTPATNPLIRDNDTEPKKNNPIDNQEQIEFEANPLLSNSYEELPYKYDNRLMQCLSYGGEVPSHTIGIGIQLNTFMNLSKTPIYGESNGTAMSFGPQPSSFSESAYHRQFEIEPYLRVESRYSYSTFKLQLLYGRSASSVLIDTLEWKTNRNYLGAGIGYDHALTVSRLQFFLYGTFRWEYAIGKHVAPEEELPPSSSFDTNEYINQSKIKQHFLSAEVGIKSKYYISTQWSVFAALGYRNYFYQQRPSVENITSVPHLFRVGLGTTFTIF